MKSQRLKWIGWASALLATFALSLTAPVGRAAILAGLNPTTLQALRFSLAWVLLAATLRTGHPGNRASLVISKRGWLLMIGAGLASGIASLAYFWALERIHASIASMLVSLYPLVVLILLALRGELLTRMKVLRLLLGLSGVYLLLGPGGQIDALGVLFAFTTAVSFAVQLVITQWYLNRYPTRLVVYYVIGITAFFMLAIWGLQGFPWKAPGLGGWLAIAALAILNTYLSRLAMFRAIREIGSGQVALLAPLETLLAVLWSVLFLNESLSAPELAGGVLILASALLAAWPGSQLS